MEGRARPTTCAISHYHRPSRKSRRALFEELERSALQPLPDQRFSYAEWTRVKVSIDYHVQVDHAYYSVPFRLAYA